LSWLILYKAILKTIFRRRAANKGRADSVYYKKAGKLSVISQRMAFYERQKPHLVVDMVAVD
jgi:hypothetical protein